MSSVNIDPLLDQISDGLRARTFKSKAARRNFIHERCRAFLIENGRRSTEDHVRDLAQEVGSKLGSRKKRPKVKEKPNEDHLPNEEEVRNGAQKMEAEGNYSDVPPFDDHQLVE